LRVKNEVKALSTLITVLLILIFTIIGAFISYMWVMASFYNMPETSAFLVIENATFSANNFTYFNLTVLNPSNSVLDANITAFRLTIENTNQTYTIDTATPELPFVLSKGTRQDFTCTTNWSNFAGETVEIEPVADNVSTTLFPSTTPKAKLVIYGFDNSQRIEHFNLTVENSPESEMNLTISALMIEGSSTYTTPLFPVVLVPGQLQTFICRFNWATMIGQNITMTIDTKEGFEQTYETSQIGVAYIYISDVKFDYSDTSYFNVTLTSLPESTISATLDSLNLTLPDNTTITVDTIPTLKLVPVPVPANQSLTLKCLWNWTDYRNQTFTVNVYTTVGFEISSLTPTTPPAVIWSVDSVNFDLDDLQHFSVNITNKPASLQQINITEIEFNSNLTTTNPTPVAIGGQATLSCGFNWTDFVGGDANITVHAFYGSNESVISYQMTLPYLKTVNASFSNFELGNPYMNVTIYNSQFSKIDANITQVLVKTDNGTFSIDGTITNPKISPTGFKLTAGTEVTIVCPWDWTPFTGKDVTVVVQTADGLQLPITLKVG
jgi:hypothetical protein